MKPAVRCSCSFLTGFMIVFSAAALAADKQPPDAATASIEPRGTTAMALTGIVHPHGQHTTWHIEYGPTAEYGQQTEPRPLPPRLAAYYQESWNENAGGWASWNGGHQPEGGVTGGFLRFSEPSNHDHNHDDGIGTLHLCKYLYPGPVGQSLWFGGGDPDLRDARITLHVRGNEFQANGAEMAWWTQSQSNIEVLEQPTWLRANWAYTGYLVTDHLRSGKWEKVEYRLLNDPAKWTYGGNNLKQGPSAVRYAYWPIDDSQAHLNCDFFHLLAYIDITNPPRGSVDFDDISIVYRNHSLLLESNGGRLVAQPVGVEKEAAALTDGWRHGEGKTWRSAANPASPFEFVYEFRDPVTIGVVQLHQNPEWPAKEVEVLVSDGGDFQSALKKTLPERGTPNANWGFTIDRGLSLKAKQLKVRILSGYRAEHWGLGEIEVFGTGARMLPEDEPTHVTLDIGKLTAGTTYHWRVVAASDAGTSHSKDATFMTPADEKPAALTGPATRIAEKSATLTGRVNPLGHATKFHFEYGPDTSYGQKTSPQYAGLQLTSRHSSAAVTGLEPGKTYHYRLIAENEKGVTAGEDATFVAK